MRVVRVVREARATVRRFGWRPVRIGLAFGDRVRTTAALRRLRDGYAEKVAEPPPGAWLHAPRVGLAPAARLPAELKPAAERLREEAERVAAHEVDYLGSGPTPLGEEIDWHRDFKSGYRWPATFYQDLEVTRLDDDSDAKVPWELSRGHQLLTLARAARLWDEARFADELERQLGHWIAANPPGVGINWVNAMEVAIRAANWVWAVGTVEPLRPLDPGLHRQVTRSLQAHARHVRANLEGSPLLRGNHYLSDVFGLLVLGERVEGDPAAPRWARTGRRAMEREVGLQVLDDGVGFEASLPYHGLALELFLLGWHVAALGGRPLSPRYRARMEAMLEVSRAVRHPDGRSPVIGDQDSGRVLPAGFARAPTHDHLLDLGSAILGLPRLRDAAPHEEVAWTLGTAAWEALASRPLTDRPPPSGFPVDGLYVLRGEGVHAVVRFGGVGQNGNGGHAHNDLSSYELSLRGAPLVVDSGTYLYTADAAARDAFRSARAHNVTVIDGLDMHPLPPGQPFQMPAHARHWVEAWSQTAERVVLAGGHDGFSRRGRRAVVRRRVELDRHAGTFSVVDEVEAGGGREVATYLHLAPGTEASVVDGDVVAGGARIRFEGAASVAVEPGWVSSSYGTRERAPVVRATAPGAPARLAYRIEPR